MSNHSNSSLADSIANNGAGNPTSSPLSGIGSGDANFAWTQVGASIYNFGSSFGGISASVSNLMTILKDKIATTNADISGIEYKVFSVEQSITSGIPCSFILMCIRWKNAHEGIRNTVGVVPVAIDSGIDFEPQQIKINNEDVPLHMTIMDWYGPDVKEKLMNIVKISSQDYKYIVLSSPIVIGSEFNGNDDNQVLGLIDTCFKVARSQLSSRDSTFKDINLAYADKTAVLKQQLVINNEGIHQNEVGNIRRADVVVSTKAISVSKVGTQGYPQPQQQTEITRVLVYPDLVYNPQPIQTNIYGQQLGVGGQVPTPMVTPCIIITRILNQQIQSLAGMLLGIINVSFLRESNNWMPLFRPLNGADGSKTHAELSDIGNIGYDLPVAGQGVYEKINTSPDKFDDVNLLMLINQFFTKEIAIMLDVEYGSPDSCFLYAFVNAAFGQPDAVNDIITAANVLTNGEFGKIFTTNESSCIVNIVNPRVPMGTYVDSEHKTRDIRDIGYIGACGVVAPNGRAEMDAFISAMNDSNIDFRHRAAMLEHILQVYLGNLRIRSYGARLIFHPMFINALTKAAQTCGYHVSTDADNIGNIQHGRVGAGFLNGSTIGGAASGLFGGGYVQTTPQASRPYFGF